MNDLAMVDLFSEVVANVRTQHCAHYPKNVWQRTLRCQHRCKNDLTQHPEHEYVVKRAQSIIEMERKKLTSIIPIIRNHDCLWQSTYGTCHLSSSCWRKRTSKQSQRSPRLGFQRERIPSSENNLILNRKVSVKSESQQNCRLKWKFMFINGLKTKRRRKGNGRASRISSVNRNRENLDKERRSRTEKLHIYSSDILCRSLVSSIVEFTCPGIAS
jgi:hypothetical protein